MLCVQALSYCDEDFMLPLQGPHLDKAEEVTNPVYLNMAAVQIKIGDYAAAAHNATQVWAKTRELGLPLQGVRIYLLILRTYVFSHF